MIKVLRKVHFLCIVFAFFTARTAFSNTTSKDIVIQRELAETGMEKMKAVEKPTGSSHEAEGSHAGGHKSEYHGAVDQKEEITKYSLGHLKDDHDFTLYRKVDGSHVGFHLPVIIIDGGVQVFSSSKFDWGHAVAENNGNYYKLHNHQIYKTDAFGEKLISRPFDLSITKNVIGMLLAALILFLLFSKLAKSYKKSQIPKGSGRFLEPLVLYVRDDIARPNIGEKKYGKYMVYLLTVFFFIWLLNLLGMLPFGFVVTNNIAFTFAMAILTFLIVNLSGNKAYWGHIFWMPGVPVIMKIVLAPIELLGLFTKPFSLMIRLFANMTAGHFVVMSLIALSITLKGQFGKPAATGISVFLALFISVIELLVAFLQAYIFTMLSSLFIGMAVQEHDHEGHH